METMSGFQITDEVVNRVVELMQVIDPTKATPEYCRAMLEYYQAQVVAGLREKALSDPDAIDTLYEEFENWSDSTNRKSR